MELTEKEYRRIARQTQHEDEIAPRAAAARYDRDSRRLVVDLKNGVTLLVPVALVEGLAGGNVEDLAQIEILPGGETLRWPSLNAEMLVPQALSGVFGTQKWMRELASKNSRNEGAKRRERPRKMA